MSLGISTDQESDFNSVATLAVTLSPPGGSPQRFQVPATSRVVGASGFAYLSLFDMAIAGIDGSGNTIFAGSVASITPPQTGELTVEIPVRRIGDFAQTLGPMRAARTKHTATRLADGRVLLAGGEDPTTRTALSSAEIYDPRTARFAATGSLKHARADHGAALLSDGRVLIAGGEAAGDRPHQMELFDPRAGTFTESATLTVGRTNPSVTAYTTGTGEKVLIAGGSGSSGAHLSADIYLVATETAGLPRNMNEPRASHAAVLLANAILLVGGSAASARGELFGFVDEQFVLTTGSMAAPRSEATAIVTDAGRVLIAGTSATVEAYHPGNGQFDTVTTLDGIEGEVSMAPIPGDRVLFAGGGSDATPLTTALVLSGNTAAAPLGVLDVARVGHTLTVLSDGSLLVAGGTTGATAEVFLPPNQ